MNLQRRIESAQEELEELRECGDLEDILEGALKLGDLEDKAKKELS
jgi:hypothetical protein